MLIFGAIRAELLHYMIYSLAEYVTCLEHFIVFTRVAPTLTLDTEASTTLRTSPSSLQQIVFTTITHVCVRVPYIWIQRALKSPLLIHDQPANIGFRLIERPCIKPQTASL
jgi:hypothetical protein